VDEWLTWWEDFEGWEDTTPVSASERLLATVLGHVATV
jgi:hypothetical protein